MLKAKLPIFAAALILMTGCQSNRKSQNQAATDQWNMARAGVQYGLAKQQYETGNFDKSRESIQQGLKLEPNNAVLRILSAKVAIEQGQLELAEKELERARTAAPTNAEADYLSGVVYQRWQRIETAYEFYTSASEKAPAELAYLLARSEMLVAMDRTPEALKLLQDKVVYFEHSGAIRDAVGQLLMQQGKFADAAAMLREASILSEDDQNIREHLGMALFYAKNYSAAQDVLQRLVAQDAYAERFDLILALGECQMHNGQMRDARSNFELAARLKPESAAAWRALGQSALANDDLKRAEISIRRSLALDEQSSQGHLLLGYVRLKQNRLSEALEAFRRANRLDSADTVSLCMIGYTFEKSGEGSRAISYYQQALRMNPNDKLAARLLAGVDLGE
ncbi:MAG: tetratricopeptide repeat protein [Phycisphaerales bacterium]|jgi:tetratricopeptide (TPR) repeat protein|nr:tetratricopeptide repeat protein [Phycisphaerales bacterium]